MDNKNSSSFKPTLHLVVPQTCRVCNTNTFKTCEGCKDFLIGTGQSGLLTYYCSAKCREEDLPKHKEKCDLLHNRARLYRIAHSMHALFIMTRNVAFDILIESVEQDHGSKGRLVVRTGPMPDDDKSFIYALDGSKFRNADDHLKMLTWRASALAINKMYPLLEECLDGLCEELQEPVFPVPEAHARVLVRGPKAEKNSDHWNEVFKIRLKSDPVWFVVDLTCNQFGLVEPIMEWPAYKEKIGFSHYAVNPAGGTHENFHRELKSRYKRVRSDKKHPFTKEELSDLTQSYVTDRMYFAIHDWTARHNTTMPKVLHHADTKHIDELIEYVAEKVLEFMNVLQEGGGILKLDQRVAVAKDSKAGQDPLMLRFHEWRKHYMD